MKSKENLLPVMCVEIEKVTGKQKSSL